MKDVEFAVDDASGNQHTFKSLEKATVFAVSLGVSDGQPHNLDVLIYSKAGARQWGGDSAVERYLADPDASVSERIVIRAESLGRVA